ncbi:MAG: hypothetical protein ACJAWV_004420 [Flammeovirgaceae bacterium]|jgi:hypothetical protein
MATIPNYISITFIVLTFLSIFLFYKASNSKNFLILILLWAGIQGVIGYSGFYTNFEAMPPRFPLLIIPPLFFIAMLFFTRSGKTFIQKQNLAWFTLLHTIRIPVEFALLWLYQEGFIPELMTFEGRNFDILAGLTAPFVYYFGFIKSQIGKKWLLAWNVVCLGLLINIIANAILSAPTPFQQFAFEQPNIGISYFPVIWLPSVIVALVLCAHAITIKRLSR